MQGTSRPIPNLRSLSERIKERIFARWREFLYTTMLSPQLRQRIYSLWTSFWSSGMTNPITSIEQITYLLFLQRLELLDKEKVSQTQLATRQASTSANQPDNRLQFRGFD